MNVSLSSFPFAPLRLLLGLCFLCLTGAGLAAAQTSELAAETINGVPVVEEPGLMIVNGQKVSLWGIDSLASDQQCWQGETSWDCGQQAMMALRHFIDGRMVECDILQPAHEGVPATGRCYRYKGSNRIDIGGHLVARGWAMDKGEVSAGLYAAAEEAAQADRRGIWDSRFQTPKDWREGVQRFVGEEPLKALTE